MAHFAVTAIGADRPGIVAALTEALYGIGGNLEDVASTILRGHFAMMLVVNAPRDVDATALEKALGQAAWPLRVTVTVRSLDPGRRSNPSATHYLVVYGSDQPGIVARLSRLLTERGANINDLSCRLVGSADEPVYAMIAEVAVPEAADAGALEREIEDIANDLAVDVTLRPIEVETT
ncbi:MAG TPA: ACT domain-containing protein [Actinomycetota bacterium]|nr:ACT domain-containing protein [Actinomycetota bacterium]